MKTWRSDRALEMAEKSGLKRKVIAAKCGVTTQHLGKVLLGNAMPSDSLVLLLALSLNTNVDYLTGKSDDQRSSKEVA